MFLYREKELNTLSIDGNVIVYGKRRVGKTSLIKEYIQSSGKTYYYFECLKTSLEENLYYMVNDLLRNKILKFNINFDNFYDLFLFINSNYDEIVFVIDEFPYLKESENSKKVDSLFQKIMDECCNIKFIISGSHIGMMQDLLKEGNPLYGRFKNIINVEEFNYIESSYYYNSLSDYDKIAFYSVFGGSPFINESIDNKLSLKENINNLFLNEHSSVFNYADNLLLSDASSKMNVKSILSLLSNSKLKYKDLEVVLDKEKTGKLAKQLNALLELRIIKKVYPINKPNDSKKAYYEINDNVLRFYFTYIYKYKSSLNMLGPEAFYNEYIEKSINTYISHRFEEQARMYFSLLVKKTKLRGIKNIGTYYYDDSKNKKNGEFDVVLELDNRYAIYEVKYLTGKMSVSNVNKEIEQINNINGIRVFKIGFINPSGFEKEIENIDFIENIYNIL